MAIISAASYEKPQRDYNGFDGLLTLDIGAGGSAFAGFFLGGITGTLIGGIHGAVKHKETLKVNGKYENWNNIKLKLQQLTKSVSATGHEALN